MRAAAARMAFSLRQENGGRVPFPGEQAPAVRVRHGEGEAPPGRRDAGRVEVDGHDGPRDPPQRCRRCPARPRGRPAPPGGPRAVQLPEKISANDSPMNAVIPMRMRDCGACSREEPQPKLLPDHENCPALEPRVVQGMRSSWLSRSRRSARRRTRTCPAPRR